MDSSEIKRLRINIGLSQQSFSNLVGVTVTTVSRWENGVSIPSNLAMLKLNELKSQYGALNYATN